MTNQVLDLPVDVEPTTETSVFFVGNATLLIRYGGFTILTDPNFVHSGEQVPLGYGLYAARLTDPALDIQGLPPVDLVVLSHFHGDHFDHVAERELAKALPIVTTPQAAGELESRAFSNLRALDTWESLSVTKGHSSLRVTATPGRHGPGLVDFALPDVMGSVLDLKVPDLPDLRIYLSGDTLAIDELREVPARHPGIDVAFLHLGGTKVMGIMVTMDGKQGVEALGMIEAAVAIPIHYDDYDVFASPLSDFKAEVEAAGLTPCVRYLERGETYPLGGTPRK